MKMSTFLRCYEGADLIYKEYFLLLCVILLVKTLMRLLISVDRVNMIILYRVLSFVVGCMFEYLFEHAIPQNLYEKLLY